MVMASVLAFGYEYAIKCRAPPDIYTHYTINYTPKSKSKPKRFSDFSRLVNSV